MKRLKVLSISIILILLLSLLGQSFAVSARPLAATAPGLGQVTSFTVLGASAVTNTGPTVLNGDLGIWPNNASSVTGFPPGVYTGALYAADAVAELAQNDATAAYNALSQPCDLNLTGQDLGGLTLTPGTYCFDSSAQLTGNLVLDALGDPLSVWIFRMGSTLTTASGSSVTYINSPQPICNVFWQVGSSATLGTTTEFIGTILALESITMNNGANLLGRAVARTGAVTLDNNVVTIPFCAVAVPTATTPPGVPTATTPPSVATAPPISGLPNTGGAPIQSQAFPWGLLIVAGISVVALALGVQTYRRTHLPKQ